MFDKILIANRGEIACRIAATARKLGIATVAVYSDADRAALHVEVCDQACHIGAASASESYLRQDKIIAVALHSGAQAIHPGYGFLSENADFASACEDAGLVFIGPPAGAIRAMGSKSEAKRIMAAAAVPLVPGYHGIDQTPHKLSAASARIGYPQLIKASAGGGGKGMRIVSNAAEFDAALISAKRESQAAFGDDRVLIERYLTAPRHVEVQVFADGQGDVVHLFERDCSIQRRHQKVLEEAPAPGISDAIRAQMAEAAINCARAIGYVGAGTVEFLLDADGSFYFMEMNTRLQVEHPVTEMITGIDLVQWQFEIAAGLPLPLAQTEILQRGHAFEARIYAESPQRDFLPASGRILHLVAPPQNASLRIESGVRAGDEIGIDYDPMIAKLVVHAGTREAALQKLREALAAYQILGVSTNIRFLCALLAVESFARADFDTGFIGKHHEYIFARDHSEAVIVILLGCLVTLTPNPAVDQTSPASPWNQAIGWRMNQPARREITLQQEENEYAVEALRRGSTWSLCLNEVNYMASAVWLSEHLLNAEINGCLYRLPVLVSAGDIRIWYKNRDWKLVDARFKENFAYSASAIDGLVAPMPGNVVEISVVAGQTVQTGDVLLIMEAMKMEHAVVAQVDGRIKQIYYDVGDQVSEGDRLLSME